MTDSDPKDAMQSTLDAEMAEVLERYLQDRDNGTALPRTEWLAQNPRFSDRLAACLDGIELLGGGDLRVKQMPQLEGKHLFESIGDYEILGELGRGGMGVVYEAREKSLDRIVALKVMRFGVVDPRALERFQREAETAGALHHTNIVPVYATGREKDTSWYAMQRIEGESLSHRIQRANQGDDPIALEEILDVGIQAAEALDHAHRRDVVHRDVKPANLIIDLENRVWLTDFGLARRLVDVGATMTGAILGTPRYMSPEQADLRRAEVDHRTDIYSLGATLYEMSTGQPAFDGDDPLNVISKIRYEEPPSLRTLRGNLPRDLEVVLAKCMEKEADRRYGSAEELAEDLRAIREDRAIRARAITPIEKAARWVRKHGGRVRVVGYAVLATAATLLLAIAAMQSWREGNRASFRLRASGGPYMTSIHPVGQSSFSGDAIKLTVPMQSHQKLNIGDYDMMLAPRGRWSRELRLPIASGIPTEFRLRNEPTQSFEVSIENGFAVPVAGFKEPAVLLTREGQLSRTTLSAGTEWSLDVRSIEVANTVLDEKTNPKKNTSLVDFAKSSSNWNEFFHRTNLDDDPKTQLREKALRSAIDLNGDQLADTLVTAIDKPALMAIDSKGKIIWARSYLFNGVTLDDKPNQLGTTTGVDAVVPGFIELQDIGDRDGDGINDLVTVVAQFREQPPAPNVRYRTFPLVNTEIRIVVVSGKSGEPIRIIQPPDLKTAERAFWPLDGVGIFSRRPRRRFSGIYFEQDSVRRALSYGSSEAQIDWNNGRRTALPSPIQLLEIGDELVAVYQAGMECRQFDLLTGNEIGKPIKVPFVPARRPTLMRLGDGDHALLYHEPERSTQAQARSSFSTRFVAFKLDGTLLWERYIERLDWRNTSWQRNAADWPAVRDVNDDGRDEFLIPMHSHGDKVGLRMLNSVTGKDLWQSQSYQLLKSAEKSVDRIELSSDIDRDGWRDWVVATIAGTPPADGQRGVSKRTGDAYVYVDWISGQTGERLAWARHPIPVVGNVMDVVEIDAIRCNVPGSDLGVVEVETVYGDADQDTELDSVVLRFHPSSPDPIAVAAGLDVCTIPTDTHAPAESRVYHLRPGPFADGDERLVLMADPKDRLLRLGESKLITSWTDRKGRSLVAIEGFEPNRLIVVDTNTLTTVWATERKNSRKPEFTPVKREDGSVDFLVQWNSNNNEAPTLLDGETGRERWTASSAPGGHVITARFKDSDDALVIVGDGRFNRRGASVTRMYSFLLSILDAKSGKVRVTHTMLFHAPNHNYPNGFDDLQFIDVNGDGTLDIVGPDHWAEKILRIAVWDGKTGQQLWTRSLHRAGVPTDYFLPFCTIKSGHRPLVAYVGKKNDDSVAVSLIICDGESGKVRAIQSLTDAQTLHHVDRDYQHNRVAIRECSPSTDRPRLGLHWVGNRSVCYWELFDVTLDSLEKVNSWNDAPAKTPTEGVLLHDVDNDQIPERFVAKRYNQRRENGKLRYGPEVMLSRYDTEGEKPAWELTLANENPMRRIRMLPDHSAVWFEFKKDEFILVDLNRGKVIRTNRGEQADSLPLLTNVSTDGEKADYQFVVPLRDGVVTQSSGPVKLAFADYSIHDEFDPRREQRLLKQSVIVPELPVMVGDGLRSLAAFLLLALMPLWYFGTMIRNRRWSLAWLLMGPPVVLLMLMAGNSEWAHTPELSLNLIVGLSWLLVLSAFYFAFWVRGSRDNLGGKAWLLIVVASIVIAMSVFGLNYAGATNISVRYSFTWLDAAALFFLSFCVAAQLYWAIVALKLGWTRFRGRQGQRAIA